jgi:transposase-like protein
MNLNEISKLSEDQARAYFERIRWPNGPVCPHCGSVDASKLEWKPKTWKPEKELKGKRRPHREGLYKCSGCDQQFSALVNTILEDTHLPIRTWMMAFAILCSSKKGCSALQLQRQLGIGSYRSAWHMCHRIRHAMDREPMKGLLGSGGGTVETDETYVGGKPRKYAGEKRRRDIGEKVIRRGRGTPKTPVVALVERGGRVRAHVVPDVTARTLKGAVRAHVDPSAHVMTDELKSYRGLDKEFASHQVVNHSRGEYKRGDASTNEVEAFFGLFKRGVMGSFHHISKQHMNRYLNEFSFRWDMRKVSDSERTIEAIQSAEGKRLMYREPIKK